MISLQNITLRRGPRILLEDLNWTIFAKQRIGLVGANGSGKSSLFALLTQDLHQDAGNLLIPNQLKLAHVAQETPALDQAALDFVLDGDLELRTLQHELSAAEEINDGLRIAALHEKLSILDAYSAPARAAQLLAGLGFNQESQQNTVASFSGGWRMRLNLARALMRRSDMLLLDEPTNHLDLDAVLWLEQWLIHYPGTLLLISHDREFLDNVVDHIAHISQQKLQLYTGNYSDFEKQRAAALMLQQAAFDKQQKKLAHLQSFIDRFRAKASKSKQAQSRLKAIARLELINAVHQESAFQFHFKQPEAAPNPLLRLENIAVGYDHNILVENANLTIAPKDRMAILGLNGAGKSSFIKMLAGQLKPLRGKYEPGQGLKIGYFAQHQIDYLQLEDSPLTHLKNIAGTTKEQPLRTFLGSFGFMGDRALEPVANFSGGEKSRLALALIIWQQPNLLLLDEPTNHLDLEMREALTMALQEYEGAIILISHDRFLVRSTVDQLFLLADKKLDIFDGDINEYQQWIFNYKKQIQPFALEKNVSSRKQQRQETAKQRELLKPLMHQLKQLESKMAKLQQGITEIETALAQPDIYTAEPANKIQNLLVQQAQLKKELQMTEEAWLQLYEKKEAN
jgi:ATP-binding cassette, subfamily F, member 3